MSQILATKPKETAPEESASPKRGIDLLRDPQLNRSAAFTEAQREALGLNGLLPSGVDSEETQVRRVLQQLGQKTTDLERYIYLIQLIDANETLFYKVLTSDPARFLPIVYAPTVSEACLKFGHIFRRPRGLYLSLKHRGRLAAVMRNQPERDVRVLCATSGERILGLGDLGANGMGIPIGKLQLYTACAAVPPRHLLPVHLDFGTNNHELLDDPLYLGLRQPRVSVEERDEFVAEFVRAVQEVFPGSCIHFEDWAGPDAVRLLARYRDEVCCYNDDIQGTAGVTLAGLIVAALGKEGVAPEAARQQIRMFDTHGLVVAGRPDLAAHKLPYAHELPPSKTFDHTDLASECPRIAEAVEDFRPTILIGISTAGKLFSREAMVRHNARPIIFALSNPIDRHECLPQDAYAWSGGKAVYAGGVQFPPVHLSEVDLPWEAALAIADQVTSEQLKLGMLFPPQSNILETEIRTAARVAQVVFEAGLAGVPRPDDCEAFIRSHVYKPEYRNLV